MQPREDTSMVIALQAAKLTSHDWRAPSGAAVAWPLDATMDDAINPWVAAAMRIVSFSILVFMSFVASAP